MRESWEREKFVPYLLINGKPYSQPIETLDQALQVVKDRPIVGPLSIWYAGRTICIGEVRAWETKPKDYGLWDEMFPVFEAYARMM